jgi:hypothetical protein
MLLATSQFEQCVCRNQLAMHPPLQESPPRIVLGTVSQAAKFV